MRITALQTIHLAEVSNLVWVELETDQDLTGLGETFRNPLATIAYLHETCAPSLLGKDPLQIERHARALRSEVGNHFAGFPSRSIELRGNSAVDWHSGTCSAKPRTCRSTGCWAASAGTGSGSTTPAPAPPTTASHAATPTRCWCAPTTLHRPPRPMTTSPPSTSARASSPARCWKRASAR